MPCYTGFEANAVPCYPYFPKYTAKIYITKNVANFRNFRVMMECPQPPTRKQVPKMMWFDIPIPFELLSREGIVAGRTNLFFYDLQLRCFSIGIAKSIVLIGRGVMV